jgi:hypothetical protein
MLSKTPPQRRQVKRDISFQQFISRPAKASLDWWTSLLLRVIG